MDPKYCAIKGLENITWPWNMNISENTSVKTVTKYSAIFFANFGDYFLEFMQ